MRGRALPKQIVTDFPLHPGKEGREPELTELARLMWTQSRSMQSVLAPKDPWVVPTQTGFASAPGARLHHIFSCWPASWLSSFSLSPALLWYYSFSLGQ